MGKPTVPNLAFEVHEGISLIVLRHGRGAPTDPEWQRYLAAFGSVAHRLEQIRILVLTDGGHPLRKQQTQMNDLIDERSVRTAVVSSSMTVRFVISILTFNNPGIQGFPASELAEALEYLGLSPTECTFARSVALRLTRAVGAASPRTLTV